MLLLKRLRFAAASLALASGVALAGPNCPAPCPSSNCPQQAMPSGTPIMPGPDGGAAMPGAAAAPVTDAFAQAPPSGGEGAGAAIPGLLGDQTSSSTSCQFTFTQPGGSAQPLVFNVFRTYPAGTIFSASALLSNGQILPAGQPLPFSDTLKLTRPQNCTTSVPTTIARGAFKITENESPRPQDRVYTTYNYFSNVFGSRLAPGQQQTDIHREVIGFEKTLLDGNASAGMRLPYIQVNGDGSVSKDDIGDLTMVLKYALINDRLHSPP